MWHNKDPSLLKGLERLAAFAGNGDVSIFVKDS
jgi:hypothetical protein